MLNDDHAHFIRHATPAAHSRPHTLLRRTAKEMAGIFYDGNRSKKFREVFPNQRLYVRYNWPEFVNQARDALLTLMSLSTTSKHVKDEIYDAITDNFEERTKHSIKGMN